MSVISENTDSTNTSYLFEDEQDQEDNMSVAANIEDAIEPYIINPQRNMDGEQVNVTHLNDPDHPTAIEQLKKLKKNIKIRIKNFEFLRKFFENYRSFFKLPIQNKNVVTGWLVFPLVIKKTLTFQEMIFKFI